MKRILLSVLCLAVTMWAGADPVTVEQAAQQASQFMKQRSAASGQHRAPSQLAVVQAPQQQNTTAYYAFNVGDNDGFVLVSADDCATPILGYSLSGSFDEATMPDNMRQWLKGYEREMLWLSEHGVQTQTHRAPAAVKEAIAPLITTSWNQGNPYNLHCPTINNEQCVTGCVATAMAQVLNYSKNRPEGTTKPIDAYTSQSNSGTVYVQALPVTTFEWNAMINAYGADAADSEKEAVAKLMAYCGASVEMSYGLSKKGGSGAYQRDVETALHEYFNMDGAYVSRDNYTYPQWQGMIYDELAGGRPLIYGGQSSGGGHSFVIDGFDGGELFHVNWGWGGSCDGYFALSVMNSGDNSGIGASSSNDGYSFDQDAIIGIKPGAPEPQEPGVQMTPDNIAVNGNVVTFDIWNYNSENTFDAGVGAIDEDGNISNVITVGEGWPLPKNRGYSNQSVSIDGSSLEPGIYHYVVASKLSSSDKWLTTMLYWKEYIEVTVADDHSVTLRLMPVAPQLQGSISIPAADYYEDMPVSINLQAENGGGEFYGVFYLFASRTETKGKYVSRLGMTILAGERAEGSFTFTPETDGTWHFWVCTDSQGNDVLAETQLTVLNTNYTNPGALMVTAMVVEDADEASWTTDANGIRQVNVMSNNLIITPTIKNISGQDQSDFKLWLELEKWDGSEWTLVRSYSSTSFSSSSFAAGRITKFVAMHFEDLEYGLYRFVLSMTKENVTALQDHHFQFYLTAGYPVWSMNGTRVMKASNSSEVTVDETVSAIDLSNFSFESIVPNSNPNTLYFLSSSQTVPASLSGKNVIQDGTAEHIVITDGHSFFSPTDFTASEIFYARTFDKGYKSDGTGWNTIVLPFAPTTIKADGKEVDWFRSAEDNNKNFWMMEFTRDDADNVYFNYAPDFQAYRPYILALPGETFGKHRIDNKEFVFSAVNAPVGATRPATRMGSAYKFCGAMASVPSTSSNYFLNAEGSFFEHGESAESPFRAYFVSLTGSAASMAISFDSNEATGIVDTHLQLNAGADNHYYDLQGRRVQQPQKGLYIVNGKKIIVK